MKTCFLCGQLGYVYPEKGERHMIRDIVKTFGYRWICLTHSYDDVSADPFDRKKYDS
jgi:hypothetical protein